MLPLTLLTKVLLVVPHLVPLQAKVEKENPFFIAILPSKSHFHMILPFASLEGRGCLSLIFGPTKRKGHWDFPFQDFHWLYPTC